MARRHPGAGKLGQAVPLDFVAGLFIFLVVLSYFLILWDMYSVRYLETLHKTNGDVEVLAVSDMLVSSPGNPENWTASPTTAVSLGLAQKPNELDPYKVEAFANLPYANAKQIMGLDRDFLVKIETLDGVRLYQAGSLSNNTSRIIEITRTALLNRTVVHVRVQLYD